MISSLEESRGNISIYIVTSWSSEERSDGTALAEKQFCSVASIAWLDNSLDIVELDSLQLIKI